MSALRLAAFLVLLPACLLSSQEITALSPGEALDMAKNPDTYIVDVRSIAEYVLIGHPVNAFNMPITFWDEKARSFFSNEGFIQDIQAQFKKSSALIFICRSGGRSLRAAQAAFQSGFAKVYSVKEGFEGDKDENGYRTVGGWKNRGLPYTYEINPDLAYSYRHKRRPG